MVSRAASAKRSCRAWQSEGAARGRLRLEMMRGEVVLRDNIIRFEDVPLCTPNGDVLIEKMNLEVLRCVTVLFPVCLASVSPVL